MLNNFSIIKKISKKGNFPYLDENSDKRISILEFAAFEMLMQVKQRTKIHS